MIYAQSLGSRLNGLAPREGYVWRGDPALSEAALDKAALDKAARRAAGAARAKAARDATAKATADLCRPRDIPTICICEWRWQRRGQQHRRIQEQPGCPWHTPRRRAA